jgi:hypothetical protein
MPETPPQSQSKIGPESPFDMGERVVTRDGQVGIIDGMRCEHGEWLYDVSGPGWRTNGWSEVDLESA